jgi:hypothetical protein
LTAEGIRSKEIKDKEDAISFINTVIESGRVVRASVELGFQLSLNFQKIKSTQNKIV